jgi:hypothetical protein
MFRPVFLHPIQNFLVVLKPVGRLLEFIWIEPEERQQMFVESNGLVVVPIEQSLPMQPCLVDQARQMHVTAEPFVRTAWAQFLH